jgi:LmbE family N-acetylglucosaminyl deacetylase
MSDPLRLMAVLAHPDDESLGIGGTLAKYAAEGVETFVITATRGERGWRGDPAANPGLAAFGKTREAELLCAARILGVREVQFLNYIDGDLDQADPVGAIGQIAGHLRRLRPQVVLTFGPEGAYGHPDHMAISQFTLAALVAAADPAWQPDPGQPPHRVSKLYFMADTTEGVGLYTSLFGDLIMPVDGVDRSWPGWPDWMITTHLDTDAHWRTALQAILCHQSQVSEMPNLAKDCEHEHARLLGRQRFIRALSLVNGGRTVERDVFEGVRDPRPTVRPAA